MNGRTLAGKHGAWYRHPEQWVRGQLRTQAPAHTAALLYVLAGAYRPDEDRVGGLSQTEMAKRISKSDRTVREQLALLESIGVIERKHRYRKRATASRQKAVRFEDVIRLLPDPETVAAAKAADHAPHDVHTVTDLGNGFSVEMLNIDCFLIVDHATGQRRTFTPAPEYDVIEDEIPF